MCAKTWNGSKWAANWVRQDWRTLIIDLLESLVWFTGNLDHCRIRIRRARAGLKIKMAVSPAGDRFWNMASPVNFPPVARYCLPASVNQPSVTFPLARATCEVRAFFEQSVCLFSLRNIANIGSSKSTRRTICKRTWAKWEVLHLHGFLSQSTEPW